MSNINRCIRCLMYTPLGVCPDCGGLAVDADLVYRDEAGGLWLDFASYEGGYDDEDEAET